ncbi:hypothetical protein ILYODFUR_003648 [Ilyodon furcidens]|uniref:Uncharacterized protein n=1 Tax=Ilyodon furcidens TaxID=33524 RepID=A0ABV0T503_9TELE
MKILSSVQSPPSRASHNKSCTHTITAQGRMVIPGYKSHLGMQGSVANGAGHRHKQTKFLHKGHRPAGCPQEALICHTVYWFVALSHIFQESNLKYNKKVQKSHSSN